MEAEKEAMWTERVGFYLDHKNLCLYDIYIYFFGFAADMMFGFCCTPCILVPLRSDANTFSS